MDELFNILKLERVENLKHEAVLLVKMTDADDEKLYCLKFHAAIQEQKLYKDCFARIDQGKFRKLILPKAKKIGSLFSNYNWWILLEYYGNNIIPWDETREGDIGGESISTDYVPVLIDMIRDLKSIDLKLFLGIIPLVEGCTWYKELSQRATALTELGYLTIEELQEILIILSKGVDENAKNDYILTNGDFQFRNFLIQPDGKLAVIDWTENAFNTPNIEPIEFPVMYQWTLMWKNPKWQNLYLETFIKQFKVSEARIRYALLVKSINQAFLWGHGGGNPLAQIQIQNCRIALGRELIIADQKNSGDSNS